MCNNVNSRNIEIYRKLNNRYCKLCVIPVIDNYFIFLTIKLLPPLIKGKLLLIRTCLFKNHHKCYPSSFYWLIPWIKFFIQPLDVHVCSPSEKVYFDSIRLVHHVLKMIISLTFFWGGGASGTFCETMLFLWNPT